MEEAQGVGQVGPLLAVEREIDLLPALHAGEIGSERRFGARGHFPAGSLSHLGS